MATFTAALANFANLSSSTMDLLPFTNTPSDYMAFLTPPPNNVKPPLASIFGMTDSQAASIMPIILHWLVCLFYETVPYFDLCHKARIWQPTDEKRNLVSREAVLSSSYALLPEVSNERIWGALGSPEYFGLTLRRFFGEMMNPYLVYIHSHGLEWTYLACRQFLCFLVFDTWAYWVHWALHVLPLSISKGISTPYTISAMCHTRMQIPRNPLRIFGLIFKNDMVYHTIHHQTWGLKKILGLYFTFWDYLNGTLYTGGRKLGEPRVKQDEAKEKQSTDTKKEI
ncbi:uncharacterized protein BCR38DRAFT_413247 [Pseudomassariella vexata]|uniref:Fatty acid hydroxylase domain-containing protein n=1 Tax=Pseudomassariella vexata TaxID=1141098 RepID=A0A1Y2DH07_9PEZI|nr:uncharacterized protein BCR38DRAFT_413247 [Pseudomassariella vexata]ORY58374.1 hypothetical protein BCR38DRAFT_413247 [Pseudomassariella vexata]